MKAKEWLLAQGHISKITRGRISADNHALLRAAVNKGVAIDDYTPSTVTNKDGKERIKNVSPTAAPGEKVIADISIPFPKDSWVAQDSKGTKHTTAICCNEHRVSVCCHPCPGGTINVMGSDVPLAFTVIPK